MTNGRLSKTEIKLDFKEIFCNEIRENSILKILDQDEYFLSIRIEDFAIILDLTESKENILTIKYISRITKNGPKVLWADAQMQNCINQINAEKQ